MKILAINPRLKIYKDFIDYPYYQNINLYIVCNVLLSSENNISLDIFDSFTTEKSFYKKGDFYYFGGNFKKEDFLDDYDYVFINFSEYILYYEENINYINEIVSNFTKGKIILLNYYSSGFCFRNYGNEELLKKGIKFDFILNGNVFEDIQELLGLKGNISELEKINKNLFRNIDFLGYQNFLKDVNGNGLLDFYSIKGNTLPYYTSKGCIFNCSFCTSTNKAIKGYDSKSYEVIQHDLLFLKNEYKIEKIVILDPLFNKNKEDTIKILDLFIKNNIKIEIPNGVRVDLLDEEIIKKLSLLLNTISISIESGDIDVNNNIIKKGLNLEKVENNINLLRKYNINVISHFIIGFPNETKKQINNTLNYAFNLFEKYQVKPLIQYPVPIEGTELFEKTSKKEIFRPFEKFQTEFLINSKEVSKNELEILKNNFNKKIDLSNTKKVIINLTYLCQNNCVFCAIGDRKKISQDYKFLVKELIKYRKNGIKLLDLDGGEPTLYPYLGEIIKIAKKLGYRINLTSSGRKFHDINYLEDLIKLGIDNILISLHSNKEEIHDKITTRKGSFKETTMGIQNIVELKSKYNFTFGINITLCKINQDTLEGFFGFIDKYGPQVVNIQFLTPFGTAKNKEIEQDTHYCINIIKGKINSYSYKIQLINLPFCHAEGLEKFVIGDTNKMERDMIFVGDDSQNLYEFLSTQRKKEEKCFGCIYNMICSGFYKFD